MDKFVVQTLVLTILSILLEVFGHVFISVTTSFGYMIYRLNPKFIFLMVNFTQWSDAGGLLVGTHYGKTPFARSISPKKTMEGVIGALIFPIIVSIIFYIIGSQTEGEWALRMPIFDYIILGATIGILAILGDLCESFLKRCANVKDSGAIFQSHGGVLDRIDSMLVGGPFLYWYSLEYLNYTHSPDYDFNKVHLFEFLNFRK